MSDPFTPKYGERAAHPETATRTAENTTQFVNQAPSNEHDVQVAHLMLRRSIVRTVGTVAIFIVLVTPLVTALIVGAMNR